MKPFVIIDPYQVEGDLAFGVWISGRYLLGDGDSYSEEDMKRCWPGAVFLTWTDLESRLKKAKS